MDSIITLTIAHYRTNNIIYKGENQDISWYI